MKISNASFQVNFVCRYESEGRGRRTLPARKLWEAIIAAQIETGNPFMLYKDACNRKSNHQNLGTIESSNLCTEVVQYSDANEVCRLEYYFLLLYKYVKLVPVYPVTFRLVSAHCAQVHNSELLLSVHGILKVNGQKRFALSRCQCRCQSKKISSG